MASQFALFNTKRFFPLFIVQFLGAFNDYLFKTIIAVMIAYGLMNTNGWDSGILIAIATGVFILPFILFCPIAGVYCEKYDKAAMIRWIKIAEIFIALLAIAAIYIQNIPLSFAVIFALGAQSAFFSPCKYSILPDHLEKQELIGGNALASTGTFLAVLIGTITGAILAPLEAGKIIASALLLTMAIIGYLAARKIPSAPSKQPDIPFSINIFAKAFAVIRFAFTQSNGVIISILGTSYFYFMAATIHGQFPNFTKHVLGADNIVLAIFMTTFSCGVTIGGLLNNRVLKTKINGTWVPLACVCMGIFGADMYFAANAYPAPTNDTIDKLQTFITDKHGARLLIDTFLQAIAGGLFIIPLRAITQDRADIDVRARVIAASNMMDAIFILIASLTSMVLLAIGFTINDLYLAISILTIIIGLFLFLAPALRANHNE